MNYKLVNIDNKNVKTGFPINLLDKVISKLKKCHISYIVSDLPNEFYDYGKYNNYKKFLHTDLFVESNLKQSNQINNYTGTFEIIFEDEDEIQKFEIGKDINQNAELVSKVNDIGAIVTLKSGIKFKIISKNIN